jgi:pimeloyl-ACP methyl ester carboxylesterase
MNFRAILAAGAACAALASSPLGAQALADTQPPAYIALAEAAGAQSVTLTSRSDGGVIINGRLDGRQFAVAIPRTWNHQSLLFAHGYTLPDSSVEVSIDPVEKDPALGLLKTAYDQGFAVGHSAYDKAGVGVEAGAKATLRLEALIRALGSKQTYVSGGSMGGSIVMALIEQHPKTFAGALSACGVTDGWDKEIGALIDMRAVYNDLTRGTPYALPGEQDLQRSALPTLPPAGSTASREAFQTMQIIKVASPILRLFADAKRDPQGPAAAIVRKVSSLTLFDPDPAAFIFPLMTVSLGMDDMRATFGGTVYGNLDKIYASPELSADEAAALNRDVQRVRADQSAVAYAHIWHQTEGTFRTPLVAVHNQIDPLVPYSQALGLKARVEANGDPRRLTLITVPPLRAEIPGSGVTGYVHCGFTPDQMANAWSVLRAQVDRQHLTTGAK